MKMNNYRTARLAAVLGLGTLGLFHVDPAPILASASSEQEQKPILQEPSIGGFLYGRVDKGQEWYRYQSVTLRIGDREKTFDWKPMLDYLNVQTSWGADLDGDGQKEWVLGLTMNTGTSIVDGAAKVIRRDLSEIAVENPVKAANQAIRSATLRKQNGRVDYTLKVNGRKYTFAFDEKEAMDWFDRPYAGNIVRYAMEHGRLTARIGTQVSPGLFIGTTKVYYEYRDGSLRTSDVAFTRNF